EAELIKRIGEPGRKLHTGRSRNDQVATDLALWISASSQEIVYGPLRLLDTALLQLALRSVDVVMPSYTHLQRAQPISAAAEVAAWAKMFNQTAAKFVALFETDWDVPLGSGAIAGTSLPIDRRFTQFQLH